MSKFMKTLKNQNILVCVVVAGLVCAVCCYFNKNREYMTHQEEEEQQEGYQNCGIPPPMAPQCGPDPKGPPAPTCPTQVRGQCGSSPALQELEQASCFPQSQLSPEELLPKSNCNTWSENSGQLSDRNFLQAGWATGISAVGQTKRNANLQLRSEVPNPQVTVSPWLQSTISPDLMRKPLEMGGCS